MAVCTPVFNPHLIISDWARFRAFIWEEAVWSCCQKIVGVGYGGTPRTRWWTPAMRDSVKMKEEAYWTWFARGSPEGAEGHRKARRAADVGDTKTQVW